MEEVTRRAETSLSKFSYALDQLEQSIRPVLKAMDELRASGNEDDLDAMSRARMHISLSYAVNALFCMYLRTQGVDPATHPVSEDIARVQEAFMRMRKVEAGIAVDHQPAPDRDRRRHIVNAKKSAQKLASLVFPEEVDLLNAIRGKKRKRETVDEGKEKRIKTEGKTSMPAKGLELDASKSKKDNAGRDSGQDEEDALQSAGGSAHTLEGTGRADKITRNRVTSDVLDTTDSSSEEERGPKACEAQEMREQEKVASPEEDVSGKKTKKKKKRSKSKSKDSSVDSKRKRSKDKKDKKDQTPKDSERSEEKRKRKKKTEKKRKSRPEE